MGLQWQWQANPKATWAFLTGSALRLYANQIPDSAKNYWAVPNILLQKFPGEEFTATVKCRFKPRLEGEKISFIVMGSDYACLTIVNKPDGIWLQYNYCKDADKGKPETEQVIKKISEGELYFRVKVIKGAVCQFSYSEDNKTFIEVNDKFTAKPGRWIGAKLGIACTRATKTNDSGYADLDWFRIEKVQ